MNYVATALLYQYGVNKNITRLLNTYDFTIIPIVNVDGYEYTHTTNRMVTCFIKSSNLLNIVDCHNLVAEKSSAKRYDGMYRHRSESKLEHILG